MQKKLKAQESEKMKPQEEEKVKVDNKETCEDVKLEIVKREYNQSTKSYTIGMRVYSPISDEIVEFEMESYKISPNSLQKEISRLTGDIYDKKKLEYLYGIAQNKNQVIKTLTHSEIGWINKGVFATNNAILESGDNKIESKYVGDRLINKKGDFNKALDMYKEIIESGNINLQTVFAIGTSATVLEFANKNWGMSMQSTINHFYSNTTNGKSTASMLAVSLGSNPINTVGNKSLFLSFGGTINSLMRSLGGNKGYPVAIDELSKVKEKNLTDSVYNLTGGLEKSRLTAGGTSFAKAFEYSTSIITNGEESILKRCDEHEGLRARVLEFFNVEWTTSKEESDKIQKECSQNYGFVTPKVAEELLKSGASEKWKAVYEKWIDYFEKDKRIDMSATNVIGRVINTLALYMVSAEIFSEVTELKLDISGIYEMLVKNVIFKLMGNSNIGKRAWQFLFEYFVENRSKFIDSHDFDVYIEGSIGIIKYARKGMGTEFEGEKCNRYIFIPKSKFNKLIESEGFPDVDVVLAELKKNNLLRTKDSNRPTMQNKTKSGETIIGYGVFIPDIKK